MCIEQITHKSKPHITPIHTRGKPLFSYSVVSRRDVEGVALQKGARGGGSFFLEAQA